MNKPVYSFQVATSESSEGGKISVSGLPLDVTALQVRELFSSIIGPVKECTINSDDAGPSTGSASVIFTRREDALLAYKELNDRMIDGVNTLRIEVVGESSGGPEDPSPAASRLGVLESRNARLTDASASAGDDQGPKREAGANVAKDEAAPEA